MPLLPPSMSDYQSQTLPSRGKQARRRSTETSLTRKLDIAEKEPTLPRADSTHRIDHAPQNTKLIHRSSMNYVLGGNPMKTPPPLGVHSSSLSPAPGQDELDGLGEAIAMEKCSKSSVTSFSSTSKCLQ